MFIWCKANETQINHVRSFCKRKKHNYNLAPKVCTPINKHFVKAPFVIQLLDFLHKFDLAIVFHSSLSFLKPTVAHKYVKYKRSHAGSEQYIVARLSFRFSNTAVGLWPTFLICFLLTLSSVLEECPIYLLMMAFTAFRGTDPMFWKLFVYPSTCGLCLQQSVGTKRNRNLSIRITSLLTHFTWDWFIYMCPIIKRACIL